MRGFNAEPDVNASALIEDLNLLTPVMRSMGTDDVQITAVYAEVRGSEYLCKWNNDIEDWEIARGYSY